MIAVVIIQGVVIVACAVLIELQYRTIRRYEKALDMRLRMVTNERCKSCSPWWIAEAGESEAVLWDGE